MGPGNFFFHPCRTWRVGEDGARCWSSADDGLRSAAAYGGSLAGVDPPLRVSVRAFYCRLSVCRGTWHSRGVPAKRIRSATRVRRRQGRACTARGPSLPLDPDALLGWRGGHRFTRRSERIAIRLSARWWLECIRAAHRWGRRCGWDCPDRRGPDQPEDDAGWALSE